MITIKTNIIENMLNEREKDIKEQIKSWLEYYKTVNDGWSDKPENRQFTNLEIHAKQLFERIIKS